MTEIQFTLFFKKCNTTILLFTDNLSQKCLGDSWRFFTSFLIFCRFTRQQAKKISAKVKWELKWGFKVDLWKQLDVVRVRLRCLWKSHRILYLQQVKDKVSNIQAVHLCGLELFLWEHPLQLNVFRRESAPCARYEGKSRRYTYRYFNSRAC